MKHLIKIYNTWREAKDIFVKPSLKCYFGKWIMDPCLPMWRRGPVVPILGWRRTRKYCYQLKNSEKVFEGYSEWRGQQIKKYGWSTHKLPCNLHNWDWMWRPNIRRKLRKYHLGWIKPVYTLPIWMSFHIYNHDVIWKTKYDEIRYEFPPQFTVVFFGLSLSFWLKCPVNNEFAWDGHYWEAILNHIYKNKTGTLKETIELTGIWSKLGKSKEENIRYFSIRPDFITDKYLEEYYAAVSEIKRERDQFII